MGALQQTARVCRPARKLSVLEMGCSNEVNFKFYPPGCRVTQLQEVVVPGLREPEAAVLVLPGGGQ